MENKPEKHSTTGTMIRNIVIGVATPVLAATIIYFLGFNNKDEGKAEFKKKKEATEKAWAAYIQNKDIFSAVMKQLGGSSDIEATRGSINHEIDITVSNLDNIKKEPGADQRVYSSVDITMDQIKEMKQVMNRFLDDMTRYAATNPTEEEGKKFILALGEDLRQQVLQIKYRDSLRLNTYYDGLNKDYKTTFPRNSELQGGK